MTSCPGVFSFSLSKTMEENLIGGNEILCFLLKTRGKLKNVKKSTEVIAKEKPFFDDEA